MLLKLLVKIKHNAENLGLYYCCYKNKYEDEIHSPPHCNFME